MIFFYNISNHEKSFWCVHNQRIVSWLAWSLFVYIMTPPRNPGWVVFSLQIVCLCVYVCVCVRLCLWAKFQPNRCTDLDAVFAKRLLSTLAQTLLYIEICDLRFKVKVTVTQYSFFLHNSLWTSILYISALLCLIKLKLVCSLDMPIADL